MGNRFFGRPVTATTSTSGSVINQNYTNPEFVARPKLPLSTTSVNVTAIAYFAYVGLWPTGSVWMHWEGNVTNTFSVQVGELGIFLSDSPPNRQAKTLLRLAAVTLHDSFTGSTGNKRNTDAFNATLYTDAYVWAGIRHTGTGGQMTALTLDLGDGYVLVEPSGTALTATNSWLATIYTGLVPYQAASLI